MAEVELKVNRRTVFYLNTQRRTRGNFVSGMLLHALNFWVERDYYSFRFPGERVIMGGKEHERYLRGEEI